MGVRISGLFEVMIGVISDFSLNMGEALYVPGCIGGLEGL